MVVLQGLPSSVGAASSSSSAETFARTAILAWANEVLAGTYRAFSEIPPHSLALLLYGIFKVRAPDGSSSAGAVSLQSIQFPTHFTAAQRAGGHTAAAEENLDRTVQESNAAHVLRTVQTLSAATNHPVVLAPTTTPSSWLDGKAFVDELRVWRWTRTVALEGAATVETIRSTIDDFLRAPTPGETPVSRQPQPPSGTASSDATPGGSAQTPLAGDDDATPRSPHSLERPVKRARAVAGEHVQGDARDGPASLVDASRQHLARARAAVVSATSADGGGNASAYSAQDASDTGEVVRRVEAVDGALTSGGQLGGAVMACAGALAEAQARRGDATSAQDASLTGRANGTGEAEVVAAASTAALRVAGIVVPTGACGLCASVMAQAIQGNLQRLTALEDARQQALSACRRKDTSALLSALSTVL